MKVTAFSGGQGLSWSRSHEELGGLAAVKLTIDAPPGIDDERAGEQRKTAEPGRPAAGSARARP